MMRFTHLVLILFNLNYICGLTTNPSFSGLTSGNSDKKITENRNEDYEYESTDANASYIDINNDYENSRLTEDKEKNDDKKHDDDISYDKVVDTFLNSVINLLTKTSNEYNVELNKTNRDAKSTWITYSNILQKFIDSAFKFGVSKLLESSGDIVTSDECTTAFVLIVNGLKEQKSWAAKFFDSTGRPYGAGSLDGSFTSLGDYDQCLSITSELNSFVGQYCLLKYGAVLPPKPSQLLLQSSVFNFSGTPLENTFLEEFTQTAHAFYDRYTRIGICMPSVCTKTDIEKLFRTFITDRRINLVVDGCHVKESIHFNNLQIVILSILSLLALIITVATCFDLILSYTVLSLPEPLISFQSDKKKFILKIVMSFSLYNNGKQLFSADISKSTIRSISGIKVLTMAWILWTHTYLLSLKETFLFVRNFMFAAEELPFQLIQNGWVLVDSFFLIGALLLTTSLLKSLHNTNGSINITQLIFNRIFRLLPSICLAVMLLFIIPPLGSGPLWREYFDPQVDRCYKYWWTTLLFINNWYNMDNMCLLHTWYMSADLQLFIASLFFVVLIYKKPKFGVYSLVFSAMSACLAIGIRTYVLRQPPTVLYNSPSEKEVMDNASKVYVHTYIHLAPYFVGVFLGYILHKKRDYKIHPVTNICVWMLTITIGVTIMLITYSLNRGSKWPLLVIAIYGALHRTAWACCVAWVIFACATGYGGPINTFLSWKFFDPLGKLSFMVYLMHFLVIWVRFGYSRAPLPFSHYTMFCEFIVNLFLSTSLALITYLSVEAPMMAIHRNFLHTTFKWANTTVNKTKGDLNHDSNGVVVMSRL